MAAAGWAGQGWADPSPAGGGTPGGAREPSPKEDQTRRGEMAGTGLGARLYRQIKRHPAVSSVPEPLLPTPNFFDAPALPVPSCLAPPPPSALTSPRVSSPPPARCPSPCPSNPPREARCGVRETGPGLWCRRLQSPLPGGREHGSEAGLGAARQDGELRGGERLTVSWAFPQLIPMIGFIGLGMGSAALYLLRLALRSPDVW